MVEYNLAAVIEIWSLTQPHTCEMGSSGFVTMSRLKFVSITRASFPIIPSTERTNGEKISVAHGIYYRVHIYFPSPIDTGAFLLVPSYRCMCPSHQI